jgi:hypothetical protein
MFGHSVQDIIKALRLKNSLITISVYSIQIGYLTIEERGPDRSCILQNRSDQAIEHYKFHPGRGSS